MAIALEFINFIVRRDVIERRYPGGWDQCLLDHQEYLGRRVYFDDYLFRDGAMGFDGIERLLAEWEARGFMPSEVSDGKQVSKDVCLIDVLGGKLWPCAWIERPSGNPFVAYFTGTEPGEVAGGAGLRHVVAARTVTSKLKEIAAKLGARRENKVLRQERVMWTATMPVEPKSSHGWSGVQRRPQLPVSPALPELRSPLPGPNAAPSTHEPESRGCARLGLEMLLLFWAVAGGFCGSVLNWEERLGVELSRMQRAELAVSLAFTTPVLGLVLLNLIVASVFTSWAAAGIVFGAMALLFFVRTVLRTWLILTRQPIVLHLT